MSRRRKAAAARARRGPLPNTEKLVQRRDGAWWVRSITGATSQKDYRCPGCEQVIVPATPHLVVWPQVKSLLAESAISERRHWHTACWNRRS